MKKITKRGLKDILDKHTKWLKNEKGGVRADLSRAYLSGANLSRANLSGANLSRVDLSRVDLSGANLSNTNLSKANLSLAYLSEANLYGANLYGTNLSLADLYRANLSNTIYNDKTIVNFQYQKHKAFYLGIDEIRIGCHVYSIKHWLEHFEEIGKREGYNEEQIKRYGSFIKSCDKDFTASKKEAKK